MIDSAAKRIQVVARKYQQSPAYKAKDRARKATTAYVEWRRAYDIKRWQEPKIKMSNRARRHTRRARLRGAEGSWTATEWNALLNKYGHRCLACGLGEVQLRCLRRKLVPDHVRAIADGGRNDIGNLQPLCHGRAGCNNHKGRKHIDYRKRRKS